MPVTLLSIVAKILPGLRNSKCKRLIVGKDPIMMQSFDLCKKGPWTWRTSKEKENSQLVLGLSPCVGMSFLVSDSMCIFCSSYIYFSDTAPRQTRYYICPWGEGTGAFVLWHKRDAYKPMIGHRGPIPTNEADLALLFSVRIKCCSSQCLSVLCFLGDCDIKLQ